MEKDLEEEFLAQWEILEKFLPTDEAWGDCSGWHRKLVSLMALWYFVINVAKFMCATTIQRQKIVCHHNSEIE